jgi:hypothetical protein
MPEPHGELRVLITSVDGNTEHPFKPGDTILVVHEFGYKHLVKDKAATPFTSTWIEFKDRKIDDGTVLMALTTSKERPGNDPDLTVTLAWTTQGGRG